MAAKQGAHHVIHLI